MKNLLLLPLFFVSIAFAMDGNYESALDAHYFALAQEVDTRNRADYFENSNETSPKYILKPKKENLLNGIVAEDMVSLKNNICTVSQMNKTELALLKELFFDLATKSTQSMTALEFLLDNDQVRAVVQEQVGRAILNIKFQDSIERYALLLKAHYSETPVNFYYNEHGCVTHECTMEKAVQNKITTEFYELLKNASDGKDGWHKQYIHLNEEFYTKAQILLKYGARIASDTIMLILFSDPSHPGNTHIRETVATILTDRTEQIKSLKKKDLAQIGYRKIAYFIDILISKGVNIAQENGGAQEPILKSLLDYSMASREPDKDSIIDAIQKLLSYGMPKTNEFHQKTLADKNIPQEGVELLNPENQKQKIL